MNRQELSRRKFLLVDDFSEFRHSVKKMLQSLGVTDVDDVGSGNDAVEKMSQKTYDVVLCDYNLGENKKDGQQILEEARFREIIKYSTIFIMITAENTMTMVMGAIEYKPDDYLTKPFTKETLYNRLEKIIDKKKDFDAIEKALANKDFLLALKICNDRITNKPQNLYEFVKIKADLCITLGDYDEAEKVFRSVITIRNVPWAVLGLGKVMFLKGNYLEAKDILHDLIDENRSFMEGYDWLAKTLEELGDVKEAQNILVRASEMSPKAILRQKALANVALKNSDLNLAERSFKAAVGLGKTSCFKSPSDYTGLAKVLVEKKTPEKALTILNEAKDSFGSDPSANLQTAVMSGIVYKELGRLDDAKKSVEEAGSLFESMKGAVSNDVAMDMAKAFFDLGLNDKGNKVMQDIVRNNHDNDKILKQAQEIFNDANLHDEGLAIIATTKQEIVKINNEGVKLVNQGKLKEAIEYFEKAAGGLPENKIINANAAQSMLMYMQKFGKVDRLLYQVRNYLEKIRKVDPTYKKYISLLALYQKMVATESKQ
ncbi:MAG: response regulator [Nitrospirae bacterium]|nr:response regulator [Nitrospirota bacterium]